MNFSTLSAPLRELTRKDVKFHWTTKEQLVLEKLKNSLVENATLIHYKVGVETEVVLDTSPVGLGAVLTQRKRGGHIHVVSENFKPTVILPNNFTIKHLFYLKAVH